MCRMTNGDVVWLCVVCLGFGFMVGVAIHAAYGLPIDHKAEAWEALQQAQKNYLEMK